MGKAAKRRTRKLRRRTSALLRTRKKQVTHKGKSGRTGSMHDRKTRKKEKA